MLPTLQETTVVVANRSQWATLGRLAGKNFCPAWNIDDYMKVWNELPKSPWFAENRIITWALVKRGEEDGEAYAFAQTERRDAFSKTGTGAVENVNVYVMSFVNTPKAYERQGYCRRLLRTIHYILSPSLRPSWPSSWGAFPNLPESVTSTIPPGVISILTTAAPPLHYFKCWIGPDEDQRPGWVGRGLGENDENMELIWDGFGEYPAPPSPTSTSGLSHPDKGYSLLYQSDVKSLTHPLSQALKTRLNNAAPTQDGTTTVVLDPASTGWLWWHIDQIPRVGFNAVRELADPRTPIGIRFHTPSSSSSTGSSISPEDGILLFQPRCFHPDETVILLTSNISSEQLLEAIPVMQTISNPQATSGRSLPNCTKLRLWGLSPSNPLVETLVGLGGKVRDRTETRYLPFEVCNYGERAVRVDGLEFWNWG